MGCNWHAPGIDVQPVANVCAVLGGDVACAGGVGAQAAVACLQITVVGGGTGLALRIKAQQPAAGGLVADGCAQVLLTTGFGVEDAVGGDALGV